MRSSIFLKSINFYNKYQIIKQVKEETMTTFQMVSKSQIQLRICDQSRNLDN